MSINEVRYLPECGSTNAYVKEHFEEFGPVGAVYTENQTAGRGRLGRSWVNAEGKALYYTVAIREPLAQPATLPLLASKFFNCNPKTKNFNLNFINHKFKVITNMMFIAN